MDNNRVNLCIEEVGYVLFMYVFMRLVDIFKCCAADSIFCIIRGRLYIYVTSAASSSNQTYIER